MEKRNDYAFFKVLEKKFDEEDIDSIPAIKRFMKVSQEKLPQFHVSNLVDDFEKLHIAYKETRIGSDEDERIKIKKAFDFLAEFAIMNSINTVEDLNKGSPPTILKLWKGGKIGELTVAKLFDLSQIRKKTWARAYCGKLLTNMNKLETEVKTGRFSSFLEHERLTLIEKVTNNH